MMISMSEHSDVLCHCPGTSAQAPSVNIALTVSILLFIFESSFFFKRLRQCASSFVV